mgnify:FL=1
MLTVIQWVFFVGIGLTGWGLKFGGPWLLVTGLLLLGFLPMLLVVNLFLGRR